VPAARRAHPASDGARAPRRRAEQPVADASTPRRLIEAAVACIAEDGYYRASSNAIARRAGVTWGVIQHHFGTRERLLLEVARSGAQELVATLDEAEIRGETPEERLGSLADVVFSHYCRPEFLVAVQILMNLTRDPRTASETIEALDEITTDTEARWQRLVDQVLEPERQPPGLGRVLFYALRGIAVGEELLNTMVARGPAARAGSHHAERRALIRALASLFDEPR
jgi:TetR/AcrR family transcriptional regulator, regulator of cefoperazone and chloramphenicol sensitivity